MTRLSNAQDRQPVRGASGGMARMAHRAWTRACTTIVAASILAGCTLRAGPSPAPPAVEPTSRPAATAAPMAVSAAGSVARDKPATASASLPDQPASAAVDGDPDTIWGAGTHPAQWIEIDLGAAFDLERIVLTVAQSPEGATVHEVWGRSGSVEERLLHTFRQVTNDGQRLEVAPSPAWPGVRFLRIETTDSPSWVAWREIEIYGTANPGQGLADLILHNGVLLTMDESRPRAEALAIAGDHILAVGTDQMILALAGPLTRTVDLGGRTVTPGFIDAHQHRLTDYGMFAGPTGNATPQAWIQAALEDGWTGLHELFIDQGRMDNLRALDRAGELRLRVVGYLTANFHYDRTTWFDQYVPPVIDSPFLKFPGVKITLDQEWGETIFFDQPTLTEMVEHADAQGWQLATHSFSLRANELILSAYGAALQGQDNTSGRHRLEHTGIISDDQLAEMKRLGILASVGLGGTPFMPDDLSFQRSVPPEQWPWMVRTRDFLEAGIFTFGHTDTPWGSVDWRNGVRPAHDGSVMWALHAAATRNDAYWPRPPEPWQVAQTISVEEAMRLLTVNAAYASFDEDRLGSLEPGKLADMVVLSANPLQVAVKDILQIAVLMTMIGGRVEYCAPGMQAWCSEGG